MGSSLQDQMGGGGELGEIKNLMQVWLSVIASLCYCYFIASRVPRGMLRLLSLLPIISLFTLLPLRLTSAFLTAVTCLFITWLANFKLLLFSFDLGPLSPPSSSLSLPLFITIACLPVRIKNDDKNHQNPKKPTKLPLNLGTETAAFALLAGLLHDCRDLIHPRIVLVFYCFLVFLLVDVLMSLSNVVVRALVGLELEPPSDEPYLATSLQDFWGRRWNLMVTNTLRHTVYKPVRSASEALMGPRWAPLAGVLAAFLVSGLMHELLFYYVTRVGPTWEMTGFIVLHGVCVVVEFGLKRAFAGRLRLHWAVSGPLTVGFVVATSFWLFFPPLIKSGADVKVLGEFKDFAELVTRNLRCISFW